MFGIFKRLKKLEEENELTQDLLSETLEAVDACIAEIKKMKKPAPKKKRVEDHMGSTRSTGLCRHSRILKRSTSPGASS